MRRHGRQRGSTLVVCERPRCIAALPLEISEVDERHRRRRPDIKGALERAVRLAEAAGVEMAAAQTVEARRHDQGARRHIPRRRRTIEPRQSRRVVPLTDLLVRARGARRASRILHGLRVFKGHDQLLRSGRLRAQIGHAAHAAADKAAVLRMTVRLQRCAACTQPLMLLERNVAVAHLLTCEDRARCDHTEHGRVVAPLDRGVRITRMVD